MGGFRPLRIPEYLNPQDSQPIAPAIHPIALLPINRNLVLMCGKKSEYVSPRIIREKMDVSAGTIRRWAKLYGWKRKEINSRVIRYRVKDVEDSLGVSFS